MSRRYRILIAAPAFYDWDLGAYVRQILSSQGFPCESFEYAAIDSRREANRQLLLAVKKYRPDVVWGLKLDAIDAETIRKIRSQGVFCFLWYVDCERHTPPAWLRPLLAEADLVAMTAKGLVPEYQRFARGPISWMYEGVHLPSFPLHVAEPVPELYRSEVAFAGNVYYPMKSDAATWERHPLLKSIQKRFHLKVWGVQGDPQTKKKWGARYPVIEWPAYNEDLVRICRGADVVLGGNRINDVELYFSNRTFLTLASGGFHLTSYVPGLETMFRNREHLVWYHDEKECLQLIEYYLAHPRLRRRIADAGRDWVRRRYGMKRQVNRILRMVDEQRGR